jgi:hypothetical protein
MARVVVTGIQQTVRELQQLTPKLERSVLLDMSQIAYDSAQRSAGQHENTGSTGALFQSLYNRQIPKGREVGHDPQRAPHAVFVQFGTRPHEIRPKTKKALRWARGGEFFFAKVVHHPGYIGDPYMVSAADDAIRQFAAIVDKRIKEG